MPTLNPVQQSALSLAIAHALFMPVTNAATITVNSTSDAPNAAGCTFREAIQVSNTNNLGNTGCQISNGALNNSDEIVFNLTGENNVITLSGSELEVTQTVSITGPGAEQLTVDANGQSRVLAIRGGENNSTANTNISALAFTGGNSNYADDFEQLGFGDTGYGTLADGGAISISNSPNSIISDVVITGSTTTDGDGGGISIERSDELSINNSVISGNSAIDPTTRFSYGYENRGGGIFISNSDFITINESSITENISTLFGGGISILNINNLSINNSTISANTVTVANGGGIAIRTIGYFTPQYYAGSSENFSINSTTVSNNIALNISQLSASTVGGSGGGVYLAGGASGVIVNSTISGNSANRDNGGGGIATDFDSETRLLSSTIVNNFANSAGGIFAPSGFEIAGNNVIANNIGRDCATSQFFTVITSGINWIGDNTCSIDSSGDPQLGPLQDNGGATFTHAPLPGSGLINASTDCSDPLVSGLDQRGEPRGTSTCFIGSVEGIQENTVNFNVIPLSNGKTVIFPL